MSRKPEYDVFINIYELALEFSKSNEQIFNELSHYLVDNLILKICIFLAQENNIPYSTTSSKGKKKTYNFPKLYKDILSILFPNVPDYNKQIQRLHNLRNLFQHGSESITLGIRSEFAIEYVRLTELILKEIGVIDKSKTIESSNYLKAQYLKIKLKDGKLSDSQAQVDENLIFMKLEEIEKEFGEQILAQMVKSDLDIRIIVYPLLDKGELFGASQFTELKIYLEKETKNGPHIDSFPAPIFGDLSITREGLQHISKYRLVGSILVQRDGLIIYNWSYGEKKDPNRETLPIYYMSVYLLGFINFLIKFYNKINYKEDIKLIFKLTNIPNWKYSAQPDFIIGRHKSSFKHRNFTPFKSSYNIKDLDTKESKMKLLQEIFNEILLGYGFSNGFKLHEKLKDYL